jgi:hypothetical protein
MSSDHKNSHRSICKLDRRSIQYLERPIPQLVIIDLRYVGGGRKRQCVYKYQRQDHRATVVNLAAHSLGACAPNPPYVQHHRPAKSHHPKKEPTGTPTSVTKQPKFSYSMTAAQEPSAKRHSTSPFALCRSGVLHSESSGSSSLSHDHHR